MTLRAHLIPLGGGAFSGEVEGHPAAGTVIRLQRLTATEMTAGLWANGKHLVGNGLLRLSEGRWTGLCTEFAGKWAIEAKQGSAELLFREEAPEVAA